MPVISLKNVTHTYSEGTPLSVSAIENIIVMYFLSFT